MWMLVVEKERHVSLFFTESLFCGLSPNTSVIADVSRQLEICYRPRWDESRHASIISQGEICSQGYAMSSSQRERTQLKRSLWAQPGPHLLGCNTSQVALPVSQPWSAESQLLGYAAWLEMAFKWNESFITRMWEYHTWTYHKLMYIGNNGRQILHVAPGSFSRRWFILVDVSIAIE